jgi:hypothetical protein
MDKKRGKPEGDTFEDVGVSGRIILNWICKRWDGGVD